MWHVERPTMDVDTTFNCCISRVRNPETKDSLLRILPNVKAAAVDYLERAENAELHLIRPTSSIDEESAKELIKTYDGRMAKKGQPGRPIYDQIKLLPKNDLCPFCYHRNISTLDHILPKKKYPIFSVTPINLVGCCSECNKLKLDSSPKDASDAPLHPYFDIVTTHQWLTASVVKQSPASLIFHVNKVPEWSDALNARVAHQFNLLGLAKLYSSQAANEIVNIRQNLQRHFKLNGADAVFTELQFQWKSRQANQLNSWQTATYKALSESDWFCQEGFSQE